jgi:hypothetical protein
MKRSYKKRAKRRDKFSKSLGKSFNLKASRWVKTRGAENENVKLERGGLVGLSLHKVR